MKLRKELVYAILAYTEDTATNGDEIPLPELKEYDKYEIRNHVKLCEEAGYIDTTTVDGKMPSGISRLTWMGHMKLEQMRAEGQ